MQIYVHRNNQQLGPFTEAEIRAQLAAGTISPQDHVWWQGQANWLPLGQSSLMTPGATAAPGVPLPPPVGAIHGQTISQFAIWSLVCGCLSILCGLLTSIPAIILGHMGLAEIKRNPALQGRGMATAGLIIGYVFLGLSIILIGCFVILSTLGGSVKDAFKTLNAQLNAGEASTNTDDSTTNSDQSTNAADQPTATPTPASSPDPSTNSPTATPLSPDSSTNSADSSTNAAPASQ
jgi:hypothetical protein